MSEQESSELNGVCNFFSETGSEGGFWAFQDARFIKKNVGYGYCKKCGKYLKKQIGVLEVVRVFPVTEELLNTGKLPELPDCLNGVHEEKVGDVFEDGGFHILKDGDRLTIYSKDNPNEMIWSGVITLRQLPLFTEHASGLWIHADQEGIDREVWAQWFFDEYPATLILTEE